jgi:hypothetical protein
MAGTTLHQVLEGIKSLDLDGLRQVSQRVQERLASQEEAHKRQVFHQALRASGLVRDIKTSHPLDVSARTLVQVQGEPVSQTIIEERR